MLLLAAYECNIFTFIYIKPIMRISYSLSNEIGRMKFIVYGYISVSTDKQSVDNQHFEIERFYTHNKLSIDHYIIKIWHITLLS